VMVTPAFSADCACVLSDRHSDYARSCVIAYWRMMPTAERREMLAEHQAMDDGVVREPDPRLKATWGQTGFREPVDLAGQRLRFLGVQDLVLKFDSDRVDAKGRKLGWAMALMEMLVDPMLAAWVPGYVREQYERWNPFFRPTLRWALTRGYAAQGVTTNARLLKVVRVLMIDRFARHDAKRKLQGLDEDGAGAASDEEEPDPDAPPVSAGEDEDPRDEAERLKEDL